MLLAGLALFALSGCSKDQVSSATPPSSGHHAHVAPHGGTLVELGDHQFNLELVHDPSAGRLTIYLLDAHAESFVRVPLREFTLVALVRGRRETVPMTARANAATGETVGDSAEFAAEAPWLASKVAFDGLIPALEIRGVPFSEVRFAFRSGASP